MYEILRRNKKLLLISQSLYKTKLLRIKKVKVFNIVNFSLTKTVEKSLKAKKNIKSKNMNNKNSILEDSGDEK